MHDMRRCLVLAMSSVVLVGEGQEDILKHHLKGGVISTKSKVKSSKNHGAPPPPTFITNMHLFVSTPHFHRCVLISISVTILFHHEKGASKNVGIEELAYMSPEFISDAPRMHQIQKQSGGLQRPPYPQLH